MTQPTTPQTQVDPGLPQPEYPEVDPFALVNVESDNANSTVVALVGALLAVGFLLAAVLLQAWFYTWKDEFASARTLPTNDPQTALGKMLLDNQSQLNSYHWVNREAQQRAIPIDRAMELVANELGGSAKKEK